MSFCWNVYLAGLLRFEELRCCYIHCPHAHGQLLFAHLRFLHFLFESTIGQFAFLFAGTALCFGNATVVRPSIKILRHTFRVVGGWRAVQGVLLELPTSDGQTVTVAVGNVHLDRCEGQASLWRSAACLLSSIASSHNLVLVLLLVSHPRNHLLRQRQAQATIRMLERMAPDADAMVIVGDFNMPPREVCVPGVFPIHTVTCV